MDPSSRPEPAPSPGDGTQVVPAPAAHDGGVHPDGGAAAEAPAPEPERVQTFQFSRVYETAGLDMTVSSYPYDGQGWTFITFAQDSDALARAALEHLDVSLLGANDQAGTLFFCGHLREPEQRAATGEAYKSFTLTHWYLARPFVSASGQKQARLRRRDFARAWSFAGDVALFQMPCSEASSSQRAASADSKVGSGQSTASEPANHHASSDGQGVPDRARTSGAAPGIPACSAEWHEPENPASEEPTGTYVDHRPDRANRAPAYAMWRGHLDGDGQEDLIVRLAESCSGWGDCEYVVLARCNAHAFRPMWGPEYAWDLRVSPRKRGGWHTLVQTIREEPQRSSQTVHAISGGAYEAISRGAPPSRRE